MVSVPSLNPQASAYLAPPGSVYDGVVRVAAGNSYGTGSLLDGGRHVLTAAHVVQGTAPTSVGVRLELPGETVTIPARAVTIHPDYTAGSGADLAIVELSRPAPVSADRYALYREGDEVGRAVTVAGYGTTATGPTGEAGTVSLATRRQGMNTVDALTDVVNGHVPWRVDPGSQIALDFDDGTPARDALGTFFGLTNYGLGLLEVMPSRGDSGGPWFIGNQVAGVTSYLFSMYSGLVQPDVTQRVDSSFGEVSSAQRVSHYAPWIDRTVRAGLPDKPTQPAQVPLEVAEGSGGGTRLVYFLVELNEPAPQGGGIDFRTVDGTARAGEDYIATAGRLVLYPGETSGVVPVEVIGDRTPEGRESFFLEVFNPRGGTLAFGQPQLSAARTIVDDDGPVSAGVELAGVQPAPDGLWTV